MSKVPGICVFDKYKVNYLCKYSYRNEYDDFSDGEDRWSKVMEGGELIEIFSDLIKDDECISFSFTDKKFIVEHFQPMTGETADYFVEFEELEDS